MVWTKKFRNRIEQKRIKRFQEEFRNRYEDTLNLQALHSVHPNLIVKINKALSADYMEEVNTTFRLKFRRFSQNQVNEFWRELKRYFILASVFKTVDMFNHYADELWHIMLENKEAYHKFCEQFIGHPIQHIPYHTKLSKPAERTLFDFYYVQLFTLDNTAFKTWNTFFKEDNGQKYYQTFKHEELLNLKQVYMRTPTSDSAEQTFENFVTSIKAVSNTYKETWKKTYQKTEDASPAYFAYVDSGEKADKDLKDLFGPDSGSTNSDSHSHDSGSSDGSSCSSCSSS